MDLHGQALQGSVMPCWHAFLQKQGNTGFYCFANLCLCSSVHIYKWQVCWYLYVWQKYTELYYCISCQISGPSTWGMHSMCICICVRLCSHVQCQLFMSTCNSVYVYIYLYTLSVTYYPCYMYIYIYCINVITLCCQRHKGVKCNIVYPVKV